MQLDGFWSILIYTVGMLVGWEFWIKPKLCAGFDFLMIYLHKRQNPLGLLVITDRHGRRLMIPSDGSAKKKLDAVAGDCPKYWWGGRIIPERRYHDVYEDAHHGENSQIMCNVF